MFKTGSNTTPRFLRVTVGLMVTSSRVNLIPDRFYSDDNHSSGRTNSFVFFVFCVFFLERTNQVQILILLTNPHHKGYKYVQYLLRWSNLGPNLREKQVNLNFTIQFWLQNESLFRKLWSWLLTLYLSGPQTFLTSRSIAIKKVPAAAKKTSSTSK